ncbi:MAG: HU family DNA-binding protein [Nitrospirota bacterium]
MTKTELINKMAGDAGISKKDAESAMNALVSGIQNALKSGDKVLISGLGTFKVKERAARKGRNPKTGEEVTIAASKKVAFSASKELKEAVQG